MRWRIMMLLLLLNSLAACNKWSDARVAETKRRGDIVCQAIDAYRARTGKLPSELKQLQPEFLRDIPQPTVGRKAWEYSVIDGGRDFVLQVVSASQGDPILDRESARWHYLKGRSR